MREFADQKALQDYVKLHDLVYLPNEIEATQIGGFRSDRVIAGKLAPSSFGLFWRLSRLKLTSCGMPTSQQNVDASGIRRSYGVSHLTIGRLQGSVLHPFDGACVPAA